MAFCKHLVGIHVKIFMDNTNSVAYIQNYGGRKDVLHDLARDLWLWCIERKIHLTVAHTPGTDNKHADELSRKANDDLEWSLSDHIFQKMLHVYPDMKVDLFASRLNKKLHLYVSRFPDHLAYAIDAFTFQWTNYTFYMFPPFSLLPKVLQKVVEDAAEAVLVCPIWPTQPWWPSLLPLISGPCHLLPSPQTILSLQHKPDIKYPLPKMRLGVFPLSGKHLKTGNIKAS